MRPVHSVDSTVLVALSRAVASLHPESEVRKAGTSAASAIGKVIARELKVPFSVMPRLLQAPAQARDLPEGCCYVALALGADGRHALLELETGLAAALVDRLCGGKADVLAPGVPSAAEAAALSYLALHALQAARAIEMIERSFAPRFVSFLREPMQAHGIMERARSWVAIELDLNIDGCQGFGRLLVPASSIRRAAGIITPRSSDSLAPGSRRAAVQTHLPSSSVALTRGDFAHLPEHDAIVPSGVERVRGNPFEHSNASTVASGADALPEKAIMREDSTEVGARPVEVTVELATLKIAAAKLRDLKADAVLELDLSLDDPILLRIGDRAVARAELVDLESALGVRVLALVT